MRLHRLHVSNVKGIRERTVEFPDSGVVVVEGPNEIGKTSMIEALDLLLDEKDSSKKRHVLAIRPIGQDLASTIEAEVSSGAYRFVYRKQWFRQPATELTVLTPRREHLTGVDAHERVRAILGQTADLHLWRALRLMQATPLVQTDLSSSSALAAALDEAAGQGSDAGAEGDTVVALAEAEYRQYYTAGQGSPTGAYRAAEERLAAARSAADAAQQAVDEVGHDVERHAAVVAEITAFDDQLGQSRAAAEELQAQWDTVREVVTAAAAAAARVGVARRELARARDRWTERTTRAEALLADETALAANTLAADEVTQALQPQVDDLARLTAAQQQAQQEADRAQAERQRAADDLSHVRDRADLAAVEARVRRLGELAQARGEALAAVNRLGVDKPGLTRVERAAADVDIALAAQQAGSARLTVTALRGGQQLEVDGEVLKLGSGHCVERSLSEPFEVVVPGKLRFSLTPETGAHARAERVQVARDELTAALAAVGAGHVRQARARYDERVEAQAQARRLEESRADILDGEREEDLRDRVAVLVDSAQRYADTRGEDDLPVDVAAAQVRAEATRSAFEATAESVAELSAQLAARRDVVELQRLEVARARSLVDAVGAQLAAERERLEGARRVEPDESLQQAVRTAESALAEAEAADMDCRTRLSGHDPESLKVRVDAAQAALPALTQRRTRLRDERIGIEARLEAAGGQGRKERLDAALSEREHARQEYDAIDRRARASRLLHHTLQRRRAEAKRAYVEPFAREITKFGRIVYAPDFEVEVADDLTITARILDGRRIEFDALSTGAKEQLAILTRLACATLVDPQQGVPVIIDDALGYSDPQRLRTMSAAFAMRNRNAQLVLLTCTPGRYAGIADAEVIRL